jgi:hypothetical protein
MTNQTGEFRVTAWDERPSAESGGTKLIRVRATMAYQGVIEGEGVVEFVMYSPDGQVTTFVGLERIKGRIEGRAGEAVFRHVGTFSAGVAKSRWVVVPDSGTDALAGLRGDGCYGEDNADAEHGGWAPLSFAFDFEDRAEPGVAAGRPRE